MKLDPALEQALIELQNDMTVENFDNVIKIYFGSPERDIHKTQSRVHRGAYIYRIDGDGILFDNNITSTTFDRFYIQIINKYIPNNCYNYNIHAFINDMLEIRKTYKAAYASTQDLLYYAIQLGCKCAVNMIYGSITSNKSILQCEVDYSVVVDIGHSILSSIHDSIKRNRNGHKVIMCNCDEIITTDLNIDDYFKWHAPEFTFTTQKIKNIIFNGGMRKTMTYI